MTATQTKTIDSIRLEADSQSANGKFYQIEINEVRGGYTVDFAHGAVGDTPRIGTKTPKPVSLEDARKAYEKLVKSKVHGDSHYSPVTNVREMPKRPVPATATTPGWIAPRLLNDVDESQIVAMAEAENWWVQIKHDGDRVQLHAVQGVPTFYSGRSGKLRAVPVKIATALAKSRSTFVIDGEQIDDTIWAFDLLSIGGTDLRHEPYENRYASLEALLKLLGIKTIKLVKSAKTHAAKVQMILDAKNDNEEGVVFVAKTAPYVAGRPARLGTSQRFKFVASGSFMVIQHNHEGRGKQSIDVGFHDGVVIGTCSVIGKQIPEIGQVVEVAYLYVESKLVQPRLKGIRHDVPVKACNRRQLKFKRGFVK